MIYQSVTVWWHVIGIHWYIISIQLASYVFVCSPTHYQKGLGWLLQVNIQEWCLREKFNIIQMTWHENNQVKGRGGTLGKSSNYIHANCIPQTSRVFFKIQWNSDHVPRRTNAEFPFSRNKGKDIVAKTTSEGHRLEV